jgi:hypothetical protein
LYALSVEDILTATLTEAMNPIVAGDQMKELGLTIQEEDEDDNAVAVVPYSTR